MTKSDMIEKIKRRLGYPVIKVELDNMQINDSIDYARNKYIRWAIGNATRENYFTVMLSAGQSDYDMPANTTEVISYETKAAGSIHTLFTIENYLYNQGMYDQLFMRSSGSGYNLVSYHIARDFLETVKRYVVDAYNFKYNPYTNVLTINPTPPSGGSVTINGETFNSPGFILVRAFGVVGTDEDLYENLWITDYSTAMCKIVLGRIRSKFANFAAIGSNTSLTMDGDSLLQEGQSEIEKLEEVLRSEEVFHGYDILIG